MQGRILYEYAAIRLVPRVEREEFFNVGVILYCSGKRFLDMKYHVRKPLLTAFGGGTDSDLIEHYLSSFCAIAQGKPDAGPIGKLPAAERFRWLTATKSTIIQASKVHSGFCIDPADKLQLLLIELIS